MEEYQMSKIIRYDSVSLVSPLGLEADVMKPVVHCECGVEVVCKHFTNSCYNCGTLYNDAGSELLPEREWIEQHL